MKFGSLFAGIGGLDLGLERAGMECVWQVENDPYATKVLEKHWPDVRRYGDIKEINWEEVERPDLVCGGFPCQPVSIAGKQRGAADKRWLWPEFAHCLRVVRPRYVLVENVPGLLARGMGNVLGDLASLGYDAEWESLPAAAFGAPHLRYRVFVVAHNGSQRIQGVFSKKIPFQRRFSWCKDVRRVEDFFGRPDIPTPLFWGNRDGVPHWVDRLRCLGNAVVPQVAEWVGRRIMEHE